MFGEIPRRHKYLRKKEGKADEKMGFCSHSLEISKAFINTGLVDCFMLSVNPIYDFVKKDGVLSISKERMDFYKECEANGIAIHIMKSLAGGSLLNKETSQLKTGLSVINVSNMVLIDMVWQHLLLVFQILMN